MSKKKKTFSDYLMLALMGLLVLGLGGFGIRNFSGGSSTIATVGDRDITAAAYHRAMAQAARAQQAAGASGTSLAALEEQGIPAQVRGQLIGFAAINNEADRIGLSVGDDEVAKVVTGIPSFHRTDGKFDRDAYEYTLKQNGWSVSEFEQNVRDESKVTSPSGQKSSITRSKKRISCFPLCGPSPISPRNSACRRSRSMEKFLTSRSNSWRRTERALCG